MPSTEVFRGRVRCADGLSVHARQAIQGRTAGPPSGRISFRPILTYIVRFVSRVLIVRSIRLRRSTSFASNLRILGLPVGRPNRFQRRVRTNSRRVTRYQSNRLPFRRHGRFICVNCRFHVQDRRHRVKVSTYHFFVRVTNARVNGVPPFTTIFHVFPRGGHRFYVCFRAKSAVSSTGAHLLRPFNHARVILFIRANFRLRGSHRLLPILDDTSRHISGDQVLYRPMLHSFSLVCFQVGDHLRRRTSRMIRELVKRVRRSVPFFRHPRSETRLIRGERARKEQSLLLRFFSS